jgi:hypothetical protein
MTTDSAFKRPFYRSFLARALRHQAGLDHHCLENIDVHVEVSLIVRIGALGLFDQSPFQIAIRVQLIAFHNNPVCLEFFWVVLNYFSFVRNGHV